MIEITLQFWVWASYVFIHFNVHPQWDFTLSSRCPLLKSQTIDSPWGFRGIRRYLRVSERLNPSPECLKHPREKPRRHDQTPQPPQPGSFTVNEKQL